MSETVAAAVEHPFQWRRDVPVSCICVWLWEPSGARYVHYGIEAGCPWHDHADSPTRTPWSAGWL